MAVHATADRKCGEKGPSAMFAQSKQPADRAPHGVLSITQAIGILTSRY